MIRFCENCLQSYDTERRDANDYFCPKCMGNEIMGVENGAY